MFLVLWHSWFGKSYKLVEGVAAGHCERFGSWCVVLRRNTCSSSAEAFNVLKEHPVDEDGGFVLLKARHFEEK